MGQISIPRWRVLRRIPWLALAVGCIGLLSCGQEGSNARLVTLSGPTMGTAYTVKTTSLPTGVSPVTLKADIERILNRINDHMSTYIENSEVSRFNRQQTTEWVEVSSETVAVINEALRVSRLSNGAFDITVGPLVNLWGFGPAPRKETIPSDAQIRDTLLRVGYRHIHTRSAPAAVRKDRPDVQVDLSAIAKGYAVDQLADYLESVQIMDYLVEIGGELRGRGKNAEGTGWKVGIEKPVSNKRVIHRAIYLRDQAMATSGDYRNYFEINGRRFSHTIDPHTGKPTTHNLASVTVLSPSSMHADAIATAIMVLGPEAGYQLVERENITALLFVRDSDDFQEKVTADFGQAFLN